MPLWRNGLVRLGGGDPNGKEKSRRSDDGSKEAGRQEIRWARAGKESPSRQKNYVHVGGNVRIVAF